MVQLQSRLAFSRNLIKPAVYVDRSQNVIQKNFNSLVDSVATTCQAALSREEKANRI